MSKLLFLIAVVLGLFGCASYSQNFNKHMYQNYLDTASIYDEKCDSLLGRTNESIYIKCKLLVVQMVELDTMAYYAYEQNSAVADAIYDESNRLALEIDKLMLWYGSTLEQNK